MKKNTTFSIGSIALIDKINAEYNFFDRVLGKDFGKAKNFLPTMKLLINNRLDKCVSVNRLNSVYPEQLFDLLGFKSIPKNIYREIKRLGKRFQFILENHQKFCDEQNLLSDKQFIDFSSVYFEGTKADLSSLGYSRDQKPDKKQITFGISVGINGIPSALTIQKGNVQDKKHFSFMLKTSSALLKKNSLLIFDCGANTKENKKNVREKEFHYLTLKQKQVGPYKNMIQKFNSECKEEIEINNKKYTCVKIKEEDEINYIFFSEELKNNQLAIKEKKFKKELEKNKTILKKTKAGKIIDNYISEEGYITTKGELQKTIEKIENSRINGIEGFFILQSSVYTNPKEILCLYKDKDKAEKLIMNIKNGTEIHPIRHWNTNAIIGYILLIFLTNFLVDLTLWNARNPEVKDLKLLKKYLSNLTLVIIYPPTGFKFHVLANISSEIKSILGDFIDKYEDKTLNLHW